MGQLLPPMPRFPPLPKGTIVHVEQPWTQMFVVWPRRTLGGRWVWLRQIYRRRVWRYTGFRDEPFTEFGDLFDVLKADVNDHYCQGALNPPPKKP
jgi:hypothetical protein